MIVFFSYYSILTEVLTKFFYPDITDIKFVINFDYPSSTEDYVHRIGRTARSDRTGTAYTFFTTGNAKQARDLIGVLKEANQHVNPRLLGLADAAKAFGRGKWMC